MSAPKSARRKKCPTAVALGKVHKGIAYRPQFALGLHCSDASEQAAIHAALSRLYPDKEVKVLVI